MNNNRTNLFAPILASRREMLAGLICLGQTSASAARRHDSVRRFDLPVAGGSLDVMVEGNGSPVLMIPSFGRGREDFDMLARTMVSHGYTVIRPQPRGVGASLNQKSDFALQDMGNDAAAVVRAVGLGPAVVVGHAYGQRVARSMATDHPIDVRSLVMLAAGGKVEAALPVRQAVARCFDPALSDAEHMAAVKFAFFAPGNDPSPWRAGWYPAAARLQKSGMASGSETGWWAAGGKCPILLLQGLQDVASVPENARQLRAEFPKRVRLVEIDRMGHAALPEQPRAIASHIIRFASR